MTAKDAIQSLCGRGFLKRLHEIILPVLVTILVTGRRHALLIIQEVVRMLLLVLQRFPLLLQPGLFLLLQEMSA